MTNDFGGTLFQTTDGEIATTNLESSRARSWGRFFADLTRPGTAETVLEHEQLTAQFVGDVCVLDRVEFLAAELVKADAASPRTALIQARVASMAHRFADARRHLAQAETNGTAATDIQHLRLNIDQACGTNLGAVLEARHKLADECHTLLDLMALASLLAEMSEFAAADRTYQEALRAYQDVSPFPVASVYFHLGLLWGELTSEPDRSHAAGWYRRAIEILPSFTKARIHLAEICTSRGDLSEAEALLVPAISSGDPEVHWRLADVMAADGKPRDCEAHMRAARSGFDLLLERHLLAFADHGAEFYGGSGNDFRRALDLVYANIANRPTLRAFEQGHSIALSGGDRFAASEFLAAAMKWWGGTETFRRSSLARYRANEMQGAAA
jgi:tetratricopeptide (TPR) repeat protein